MLMKDSHGNCIQRDAWSHLVEPGMTVTVQHAEMDHRIASAEPVQPNHIHVTSDDSIEYIFAYENCRNWSVGQFP